VSGTRCLAFGRSVIYQPVSVAVLFGRLIGTQGAIWLLAVAWFVPWVGRRGLAGDGTQQGILLCFHHGCNVGHDAFLHVRCGRGSVGSGLLDSLTKAGVTFTAGGCRDCVFFEVLLQNFDQVSYYCCSLSGFASKSFSITRWNSPQGVNVSMKSSILSQWFLFAFSAFNRA
jgi:hypothetical protein